MNTPQTGIKRLFFAFINSYNGFIVAFRTQESFRLDLLLFMTGSFIAVLLPISILAKGVLITSLMLILLMELTNTAIELLIDRISLKQHPLSKQAKDIGSFLVFLSIMNALFLWLCILTASF